MFTKTELIKVKRKALRAKIWFRVLNEIERRIVDLTIRVVDEAKSKLLVKTLKEIVNKLMDAIKDFKKLVYEVGRPLAKKISDFLVSKLGYREAREWAYDRNFWEYLTINKIYQPKIFDF